MNKKPTKRLDSFLLQQEAIYDQLQEFIDENNQLKVEKAILEKELEVQSENKNKFIENVEQNEDPHKSEVYKSTLDAKDSLINELEFKIFELENATKLNTQNTDFQKKAIDELNEDVKKNEKYKICYEEAIDENDRLKKRIEQLETRNETLNTHNSQYRKNEIALAPLHKLQNFGNNTAMSVDANSIDNIIFNICSTKSMAGDRNLLEFNKEGSLRHSATLSNVRERAESNTSDTEYFTNHLKDAEATEKKISEKLNLEKFVLKLFSRFEKDIQGEINVLAKKDMDNLRSLQEIINLQKMKERVSKFINEQVQNENFVNSCQQFNSS